MPQNIFASPDKKVLKESLDFAITSLSLLKDSSEPTLENILNLAETLNCLSYVLEDGLRVLENKEILNISRGTDKDNYETSLSDDIALCEDDIRTALCNIIWGLEERIDKQNKQEYDGMGVKMSFDGQQVANNE